MIPLLKKLGFVDQANVPTQAYRDFRDDTLSGQVMSQRIGWGTLVGWDGLE